MILEWLKEEVLKANVDLVNYGLAALTWGNVSGISRSDGLVIIKPSGIAYDALGVRELVVVDLDGRVVEGKLSPSSDTPTHVELYKAFPAIGGISHTHSIYATMFAQACREIPCLGTTHADHFDGPIPVTRFLTAEEVEDHYERSTGKVIVERFADLDAMGIPGVLVAGHGPFCWGRNASDSVMNSFAMEQIAQMAFGALQLNPDLSGLPRCILSKHHQRKHGPDAYYGQKNNKEKL